MHTARMDEMVNFSCIVYGGRPTPNLVWYRGARRIEGTCWFIQFQVPQAKQVIFSLFWFADGADRSGYTLEESSDGSATHSSLSFKARSSDNEADFTCQAESPALVKPHAASVRLEVLCKHINIYRGVQTETLAEKYDTRYYLGSGPMQVFPTNLPLESAIILCF